MRIRVDEWVRCLNDFLRHRCDSMAFVDVERVVDNGDEVRKQRTGCLLTKHGLRAGLQELCALTVNTEQASSWPINRLLFSYHHHPLVPSMSGVARSNSRRGRTPQTPYARPKPLKKQSVINLQQHGSARAMLTTSDISVMGNVHHLELSKRDGSA